MPLYRLNYERLREPEGCPWALEDARGFRTYHAEVRFEVPARTVFLPGTPRGHGYLEAEGDLHREGGVAVLRPFSPKGEGNGKAR